MFLTALVFATDLPLCFRCHDLYSKFFGSSCHTDNSEHWHLQEPVLEVLTVIVYKLILPLDSVHINHSWLYPSSKFSFCLFLKSMDNREKSIFLSIILKICNCSRICKHHLVIWCHLYQTSHTGMCFQITFN